jgi:exopolyphosphatase/guanosine-5'-triphosphate,3'-diphosphate pyrophosphatase
VKDGILLDLVDDLTSHPGHEARHARGVYEGALALGRRYLFDEPHAVQVARLCGSLFDQLAAVHKLPPGDRNILIAAGLLHDIGSFVSRKKHHLHSHYLISHSDIPGLSPRETRLAAGVSRYHRKGEPSYDHEAFSRLDDDEQDRVVRMASILRVADALDREHRQVVRKIRVKRGRSLLLLEVEADEDLVLERYAFKRRAQLMSSTFGVKVKLKNPGHPA